MFCQSDDDEQLILTVPFRQIVNVTSVVIQGPADGTAPKTVKIFVNKPSLSFDNCGKKATEQLTLTSEQVTAGGSQVPLTPTDYNPPSLLFFKGACRAQSLTVYSTCSPRRSRLTTG